MTCRGCYLDTFENWELQYCFIFLNTDGNICGTLLAGYVALGKFLQLFDSQFPNVLTWNSPLKG